MGMDALTSNGAAQTWLGVGTVIRTDRVIAAVKGNSVTLDAPLADSFDATYVAPPGGTMTAYTFPGRISGVGVEHLQVTAPPVDVIISSPQFTGAELGAVADAWLSDLVFQDTQNTVTVDDSTKRVTIDDVHVTHTVNHTGDRMADFGLSGTQILVNKSSSNGTGEWPLVTQGEVSGPLVVLNFSSTWSRRGSARTKGGRWGSSPTTRRSPTLPRTRTAAPRESPIRTAETTDPVRGGRWAGA